MTDFQSYLINVGIRSSEYGHADDVLFENVEYFHRCFNQGLSAYKSLLFLHDFLNGDYKFDCKCKPELFEHHFDADSFPYGDTIEYDVCTNCGKTHNYKIK